jgi:integrase
MPQIKPNALTVKAKLKERGNYTIEKHPGLWLASRGDGNGSWRVRYRPPGEKQQRWHTLSNDARNADFDDIVRVKDQWLGRVRHDHVDPKSELEAALAAKATAEAVKLAAEQAVKLTLGAVIDQWIAKPRERELRPRTVALYRWMFDAYVVPELGKRPIAEITKAEVKTHLDELRERLQREGGRAGTGTRGEMAGKTHGYLKAVFEFAVDEEYIARNPMRGIARPVPLSPEHKRARPLRPAELQAVWLGIDQHLEPTFARAIKLALLLGRRRAEIAGAEIDELHLDGAEPHWLVRPRTGNKSSVAALVPLPTLALNIIREALGDAGGSRFLFPISRGAIDRPATADSLSHAWIELRRAVGASDEVTLHAARALITDALENMGVPDNIVSHVLHHTSDMKSTTAKKSYSSNTFRAEKLKALTLWETRLLEIVEGRPASGLRW